MRLSKVELELEYISGWRCALKYEEALHAQDVSNSCINLRQSADEVCQSLLRGNSIYTK